MAVAEKKAAVGKTGEALPTSVLVLASLVCGGEGGQSQPQHRCSRLAVTRRETAHRPTLGYLPEDHDAQADMPPCADLGRRRTALCLYLSDVASASTTTSNIDSVSWAEKGASPLVCIVVLVVNDFSIQA